MSNACRHGEQHGCDICGPEAVLQEQSDALERIAIALEKIVALLEDMKLVAIDE